MRTSQRPSLKHNICHGLLVSALVALASPSFGAGYEKANLWSGRYAAQAGAAVAQVEGPESLLFNPAGLVGRAKLRSQAVLGVSPTASQFSGPAGISSIEETGNWTLSPVYSLVASHQVNPNLGLGLGFFTAGGSKSDLGEVNFASPYEAVNPKVSSSLSIHEAAIGVAYQVASMLRMGVSYRASYFSAAYSLAETRASLGGALVSSQFSEISGWSWSGFRAGLQWDLWQSGFRLGAAFRSPVTLGGTARASGLVYAGTSTGTTVSPSNVEFETTFPWALALGAQWDWNRSMRWNVEYSFTNYSANEAIDLTGTFASSQVTDIPLQWSNQHVGRLGWEWQATTDAVLRAGYALTSRVTNPKYARATYSSPGWGHSITGGGGLALTKSLRADVALEFAFASGSVSSSDTSGTSNPVTLSGDYSTRAWVLHSSVGYQF